MAVAPGSKAFRHFDVADVFSSIGMIRLLQRQGFIEHKPTSASEAAHQQRLLPVGYQFKLVSLQALHDGSLYCVLHHDAIGHVYPGPEVTINVPAARKRSFLILRTRFARRGEFVAPWTRSLLLLRIHYVHGGEFAIKVPASRKPLILHSSPCLRHGIEFAIKNPPQGADSIRLLWDAE